MNSCAECWFYSLSLAADGFRCFEFLIPSDYEWEVFVLIFFFVFSSFLLATSLFLVILGFLEKALAPHSSTLAWKIPWMEESSRLQSMGSLRVVTFPFPFYALEKEMATHSSVLAWRIPGMGEPGGLPSVGSHRVGHD